MDVCQKCAAEAKALGIAKWVEVSTAQVYAPGAPKKPCTEASKLDPWTRLAKFKLDCEEMLKKSGLNVSILRPAMVYGPGDTSSIAPRIIVAAGEKTKEATLFSSRRLLFFFSLVYKKLDEKQKNLWTKELGLNTVHVDDVCAAIWAARGWPNGQVYNLSDQSEVRKRR